MYIKSFKELIVWQKLILLVKDVYNVTSFLPDDERYCLVSQMRRAAISISSNIADGKKRRTKKDFLSFLRIASGFAAELETQMIILSEIYENIDVSSLGALLEEVQKMLAVMIKKMEFISNS